MRIAFFIFALLLTVNGCLYVDDSRHEVPIVSNYDPSITISSNLDTLDSIPVVRDSLLFKYEIEIDTGRLYFVDLYLGNMQIFRSDTVVDSLWLYPYFVNQNGNYELSLLAYYKTYTNSLADIMNAEFYSEDASWLLLFTRDPVNQEK